MLSSPIPSSGPTLNALIWHPCSLGLLGPGSGWLREVDPVRFRGRVAFCKSSQCFHLLTPTILIALVLFPLHALGQNVNDRVILVERVLAILVVENTRFAVTKLEYGAQSRERNAVLHRQHR